MKTFKRLLLVFAALGLCLGLSAQTVKWEYKCGYDGVRRLNSDYLLLQKDNNIEIRQNDGKVVLEIKADVLTDFVNGFALVLDAEPTDTETLYRLVGFFSEDGVYQETKQKNYYVDRYPFFSDGFLPVYILDKGDKKYGFIDKYLNAGELKYVDILPVVGGGAYACEMGKKGKTKWVQANPAGGKGRVKAKQEAVAQQFAGREHLAEYLPEIQKGPELTLEPGIQVVEENGLYGYKRADGVWIAPPQFTRAEPFSDGLAVVENNQGMGVIRMYEGTVVCTQEPGGMTDSGYQSTVFNVTLPPIFNDNIVSLRCLFQDETRNTKFPINLKPVEDDPTVRTTDVITVDADAKTVEITSENLVIGRQFFEKNVPEDLDAVKIGLSASKVRAGSNDRAKVTVTVTNTSDETLVLNAYASGKNVTLSRSKLTVKPRGSQSFVVTFSNVRSAGARSITVSGETDKKVKVKAKSANVQVTPFL